MTTTASPAQTAKKLRADLAKARESATTIQVEIARSRQAVAEAEAAGNLEASVNARSRLVALESALTDATSRMEAITADLAPAELLERREAGLGRMATLTKDEEAARLEFVAAWKRVNDHLGADFGQLVRLYNAVAGIRSRFIAEAAAIGYQWHRYTREENDALDKLFATLEESGADVTRIKRSRNTGGELNLDLPALEPFGRWMYEILMHQLQAAAATR